MRSMDWFRRRKPEPIVHPTPLETWNGLADRRVPDLESFEEHWMRLGGTQDESRLTNKEFDFIWLMAKEIDRLTAILPESPESATRP